MHKVYNLKEKHDENCANFERTSLTQQTISFYFCILLKDLNRVNTIDAENNASLSCECPLPI